MKQIPKPLQAPGALFSRSLLVQCRGHRSRHLTGDETSPSLLPYYMQGPTKHLKRNHFHLTLEHCTLSPKLVHYSRTLTFQWLHLDISQFKYVTVYTSVPQVPPCVTSRWEQQHMGKWHCLKPILSKFCSHQCCCKL